ncbi:hypothetical protein F5Y15DRAFT_426741 [Xylariaceae sp. FL0016]|nr:hypothetical protein F5Y15DRAFT_426741 [Xylariaceae sp. FL0016]
MSATGEYSVSAAQAIERLTAFDKIQAMVERIVREELGECDKGSAVFFHVAITLDHKGQPFRPHEILESKVHKPLLVPNIRIYLARQPADLCDLGRCVEILRQGYADDSSQWEEEHGRPPLESKTGRKFSVEFGGDGWTAWFPPCLVELPCKDGQLFTYHVGSPEELRQWEEHIMNGHPMEIKEKAEEPVTSKKTKKKPASRYKTSKVIEQKPVVWDDNTWLSAVQPQVE